uniref:Secreted protein n=1 Tax=Paramormyrops kingsleyae TaxID=1676925 RepID=A0A3B3QRN6_9TELE
MALCYFGHISLYIFFAFINAFDGHYVDYCHFFIGCIAHPGFQFLELFLSTLHGQALSFVQTVLQVLHCDLEVLLHPLQVGAGVVLLLQLLCHHGCLKCGFISAPDFCIQSALHGINDPLAVPLDLLHLLIFLSQLPVNFTLDLVELQLDT